MPNNEKRQIVLLGASLLGRNDTGTNLEVLDTIGHRLIVYTHEPDIFLIVNHHVYKSIVS